MLPRAAAVRKEACRSGTRVLGDAEGRSSQPQRRESMGRPAAHGQEAGDPRSDYRNLNLRTVTDSYVIPNLHSLNFQLKGKQVFSLS